MWNRVLQTGANRFFLCGPDGLSAEGSASFGCWSGQWQPFAPPGDPEGSNRFQRPLDSMTPTTLKRVGYWPWVPRILALLCERDRWGSQGQWYLYLSTRNLLYIWVAYTCVQLSPLEGCMSFLLWCFLLKLQRPSFKRLDLVLISGP